MRIRVNPGIASFVYAVVIRLLGMTWRIEWRNPERLETARGLSKQVIVSAFHGRLFVVAYALRRWRISVLVSEHHDGDIMGRAVARIGWGHVKGSSTRRGAAGFRELASVLRSGRDAGITVDGPRGPRGRAKRGAIELSRATGAAILPVTDAGRPRLLLSTWDRFQIPAPFARVVIAYGEPFVVPAGSDRGACEEARIRLDRTLRDLTAEIDGALGYREADVWPHEDR